MKAISGMDIFPFGQFGTAIMQSLSLVGIVSGLDVFTHHVFSLPVLFTSHIHAICLQ
jgi:hypothetical protein